MADRFFSNDLPDFVEEREGVITESSLHNLLYLPYTRLADKLLAAALHLKDQVVNETWIHNGGHVKDFTLYTGALGTAFLLFKSYEVTNNNSDLELCAEIIGACDKASKGSPYITFICGRVGVCALGAVVAKYVGDKALLNYYLSSFRAIKLPRVVPNELLYGRAGYLWACSFLNKHLGEGAIPAAQLCQIAKDTVMDGRRLAKNGKCPLMFEWHGERYWGAAHGVAGIMHVLMDMNLKAEEQKHVKDTLRYMIQNCFPSGNYPPTESFDRDQLVHWCHGAPGVALTLIKAAQVFQDQQYLKAAAAAAEVVWNRGLLKRVGVCHGISGNAYVFLSLYRLTGNLEHLYRAKAFACFLLDRADLLIANGMMHGGDHPYSLFEGQAGMAYLFLDMVRPLSSRFPAYEL